MSLSIIIITIIIIIIIIIISLFVFVYHNFICHLVAVILNKYPAFSLCDELNALSSTLPPPAKSFCVPGFGF